jgi:endonuclease G, mitochondrial
MMRKSDRKFVLLVGIVFSFFVFDIASAKIEAILGSVSLPKNSNIAFKPPTTNESEIIISRTQYVISYNKSRRNPNWVAWKVDSTDLGSVGRTNHFAEDGELDKYLQQSGGTSPHAVRPSEYSGSCYDRGHQIPSADRSVTIQDNEATFMMSNMLPQTPYLNRVVWMHLEQYTRDLVKRENKVVYVVAGPIYDQDFGKIGPQSDIQVPSKNFKVLVILDKGQTLTNIDDHTETIAVIMPNVLEDGSRPDQNKDALCQGSTASEQRSGRSNDWEQYKTTVSEVQKESGITLFP